MSYYVYAKNKEHDKDHLKVENSFFSFLRIIFGFGYCVTTWSQLECQLWGEEEKKTWKQFFSESHSHETFDTQWDWTVR